MADGLTTVLATYGPDIAKALTAGVMGLSVYVWNQREKSIDAIEADIKHERENNEKRIVAIYQKIEQVTLQITVLEKEMIQVKTRQEDCDSCP